MNKMSLDVNCFDRTRRTKIFTCATTDASFFVNSRYFVCSVFLRQHHYSFCRAMSCTVAA